MQYAPSHPRTLGWRAFAFTLALIVSSCGGGDDGDIVLAASGGSGSGFTARGSITAFPAFGSIVVNGIEIATNGATIVVDGVNATEGDLKLGQVVEVHGTLETDGLTGTARSVSFDDDVEGPIGLVNPAARTFLVLGQSVRVTNDTVFGGTLPFGDFTDLTSGITVEVSGFVDSAGAISATRIEVLPSAGQLEISGVVSGLDPLNRLFSINALTVDYSSATVTGSLANGGCVEAKGAGSPGGTLFATSVGVKACGVSGANNDHGNIEGLVTRLASASDFSVGGQRVTTSSTTVFTRGGTNASGSDLQLDMKVAVEGTFDSSGTLQASTVDLR